MSVYARPPGQPFKRLFFAMAFPGPQAKAIARWRNSLNLGNARRVPAANFHITLLFLGDVSVELLPAVVAAADSVTRPTRPLRVVLDTLEAWHRSSVLALTADQPPAPLLRLAYDLQQAMQPLGLTPELQGYRPHLTLARDFRNPAPEAVEPPEFWLTGTHFALFESRKGQYLPVQEWSLS
ncbi:MULTISPECIES: RNA 2',3'-cyclic phosphodiesterase [Pseudomonas]|uniref:RNA 2',3'-cyclic phosphodiesterase n=1 Tax=Pseudomonas quercus TaxID=2722792 RepID=A0ABX0YG82_9PSED|nr:MULTISPECIES: RNA 2',3'-cyclic phosphodiesterase [Pseudomonas]MBF7142666.1 RNA 2',3'-cyclic phosphodiesterase [Pseudomonas sp. LY10J]NJP01204.1 RNA 2',3'-cyclic phosphodiesterase [Pseudomonas quercus]